MEMARCMYTPQHNGVVERKNWTIMEMARCMLENKLCSNYDSKEGLVRK
jgi:hypothetical protein